MSKYILCFNNYLLYFSEKYSIIEIDSETEVLQVYANADLNEMLSLFAEDMKEIFRDKLREIILYGSYARGDYDAESDVDIAVIVSIPRADESIYNKQIIAAMENIYDKFGYRTVLSPIVISADFFDKWKNDLPFYSNISCEGVKIVA